MDTDVQLHINSLREAIVLLDHDLCVEAVNDAFCRRVDRSRTEIESLHISELLDEPVRMEGHLHAHPAGPTAEALVAECRLRDVGDRAMLVDMRPLKQNGFVLIVVDDAEAGTEDRDEVRAITARLTMAKDRERLRVASILHDEVQQRLFAMGLSLSAMKGDQRSGMTDREINTLDEIQDSLVETRQILRNIAADLSPPALLDDGLRDALTWLAARVKRQFGLDVRLFVEQPSLSLVEEIRVLLYRCVHELLFNVVQHAGTLDASVTVRSDPDPDHFEIVVEDAGTGFDTEDAAARARRGEGIGLSSLREELRHFGGTLDTYSSQEEGTRITIRVPTRCMLHADTGRRDA